MLCEPHSVPCESIDVRSLRDGMPVATQVTVSQVVGQDEHDVGAVNDHCRANDGTESKQETGKCLVHV